MCCKVVDVIKECEWGERPEGTLIDEGAVIDYVWHLFARFSLLDGIFLLTQIFVPRCLFAKFSSRHPFFQDFFNFLIFFLRTFFHFFDIFLGLLERSDNAIYWMLKLELLSMLLATDI